jgi:hypothetical protein
MRRLLLVVEAAFQIKHRGLVLTPTFPLDGEPKPPPTHVTLMRPDGSSRDAQVRWGTSHFNVAPDARPDITQVWRRECVLTDADASDVPPGTEVWYEAGALTDDEW